MSERKSSTEDYEVRKGRRLGIGELLDQLTMPSWVKQQYIIRWNKARQMNSNNSFMPFDINEKIPRNLLTVGTK